MSTSKTDEFAAGEDRSMTIAAFCAAEAFSKAQYFKLKRLGLGPAEFRIPGTALIRISPQARADWHARMADLQNSRQAKLEAERRRQQSRDAARCSAASPNHVSKRGKPGSVRPTPNEPASLDRDGRRRRRPRVVDVGGGVQR